MDNSRRHVLIISYPGLGHYIPALELARRVVPHHDVTLAISSSQVAHIGQRNLFPVAPVRFYPIEDNLPSDLLETFTSLTSVVEKLAESEPYYAKLIGTLNTEASPLKHVDAVLCSINHLAPCEPCYNQGIPLYVVCFLSAGVMSRSLQVEASTPTIPDDIFFSKPPVRDPHTAIKDRPVAETIKAMSLNYKKAVTYSKGILLNSFEELEPSVLEVYRQNPLTKDKVVRFIGPLVPAEENRIETRDVDVSETSVMKWMDKQSERSVVYFSFGTIASTSKEQINQIARALMSINRPFIWSLRDAQQAHLPETLQTADVDSEQKYLIVPWLPQKKVLAHKSTAVFVTHCGWNSTLEAVYYGVPVVAWPMYGDQHSNSRLLNQLGVAVTMEFLTGKTIADAAEIVQAIERAGEWNWNDGSTSGYTIHHKIILLSKHAKQTVMATGKSSVNLFEILEGLW